MTYLNEEQAAWVLSRAQKAVADGKRIILTSHHQLFTSASGVGKNSSGVYPSVNTRLYAQLQTIIPSVDLWFWGHEHSLQAFSPYAGLQRGRMIGASAIPQLLSSNVGYASDDGRLALSCTWMASY